MDGKGGRWEGDGGDRKARTFDKRAYSFRSSHNLASFKFVLTDNR